MGNTQEENMLCTVKQTILQGKGEMGDIKVQICTYTVIAQDACILHKIPHFLNIENTNNISQINKIIHNIDGINRFFNFERYIDLHDLLQILLIFSHNLPHAQKVPSPPQSCL
jgi:hypothetical protein